MPLDALQTMQTLAQRALLVVARIVPGRRLQPS
jgi:hypothetical protein